MRAELTAATAAGSCLLLVLLLRFLSPFRWLCGAPAAPQAPTVRQLLLLSARALGAGLEADRRALALLAHADGPHSIGATALAAVQRVKSCSSELCLALLCCV